MSCDARLGASLAPLLAAALLGCSDPEPSAAAPSPVEPPPAAEEAPAPAAAPDPGSACGRALACCRAYAEAVPNVVADSACAGPAEVADRPDADARCRAMAAGWRETLALLPDVDPPEACGAP